MSRRAVAGRDIGDRPSRTYGQFCPIAAGLDVVGDRWVLLICRELAMGDRRFTDLRRLLPGIAPNLLSERLKALQAAGLVMTFELPAPAARQVYRLTDEGERIKSVLRALARFGAHHLDGTPSEHFGAERAALTLLLPWAGRTGREVEFRLRLELPTGDRADVVIGAAGPRVVSGGDADEPDAVLACGVAALVATRREERPLDGRLTGPGSARARDLFALRLTADESTAGTLGG